MVTATATHPWKLVGPWYRWGDGANALQPGVPEAGRETAPIIQKYATSRFMDEFLEDPQHSLKWVDEDRVSGLKTRKLFLETHDRFYLVVAELHCDAAGFPRVDRDAACEAGFVVRRYGTEVAPTATEEVAKTARKIRELRAKERFVEARLRGRERRLRKKKPGTFSVSDALTEKWARRRADLQVELSGPREELEQLRRNNAITTFTEGWYPGEIEGIGSWKNVEAPAVEGLDEQMFPLYPLIPDPADGEHSGHHGSIWFGVVPVGSSDLDEKGGARFDDRHNYWIECFVRRHEPECPKSNARADCKGELVWSEPTETYRLASHFDLNGTSHRPVMIQLPDLEELKASAAGAQVGTGLGVGMIAPAGSSLQFDSGEVPPKDGGVAEDGEICFFATPLITIVAMFLLKLFLPIVVFLFQLWFLLKLKLCIPPSFSVGIDADLQLELVGELGLKVGAKLEVDVEWDSEQVDALLEALDDNGFSEEQIEVFRQDDGTLDMSEIALLVLGQSSDFSASVPESLRTAVDVQVPAGLVEGTIVNDLRGLAYYERQEWPTA